MVILQFMDKFAHWLAFYSCMIVSPFTHVTLKMAVFLNTSPPGRTPQISQVHISIGSKESLPRLGVIGTLLFTTGFELG